MKSIKEIREGELLFSSEDLMEGFFSEWQDEHPDKYEEGFKYSYDKMLEVYNELLEHAKKKFGSVDFLIVEGDTIGKKTLDYVFASCSPDSTHQREIYRVDNDIYFVDTKVKICGGWPVLDYRLSYMLRVMPKCWRKRCDGITEHILDLGRHLECGSDFVSRISYSAKKGFYNVFNV